MNSRVSIKNEEKKAKRKNSVKKKKETKQKKKKSGILKLKTASPGVEHGLSARASNSLTTAPQ